MLNARNNLVSAIPVLSDCSVLLSQPVEVKVSLQSYELQMENLLRARATAKPGQPLFKFAELWLWNQDKNLASNIAAPLCDEDLYTGNPQHEVPDSSLVTNQQNLERQSISIFVDYSNITAGLEIPGGNHPINPYGLAQFLENNRFCTEKQIAGSFPHAGHDIWKIWNQLGYRTRIASSGKELFVDDSLHAQIFRLLLQKNSAAKNTIVLVTGDGNSNNNYSSFVECVVRAVELNHRVEICSWKQRLNKVYLELASKYTRLITIRYLDSAKHTILNFT